MPFQLSVEGVIIRIAPLCYRVSIGMDIADKTSTLWLCSLCRSCVDGPLGLDSWTGSNWPLGSQTQDRASRLGGKKWPFKGSSNTRNANQHFPSRDQTGRGVQWVQDLPITQHKKAGELQRVNELPGGPGGQGPIGAQRKAAASLGLSQPKGPHVGKISIGGKRKGNLRTENRPFWVSTYGSGLGRKAAGKGCAQQQPPSC